MIYTSLKLSKQLSESGCKLESEYWHIPQPSKTSVLGKYPCCKENCYPAYDLLWDVCVKYPQEFFGDEYLEGVDFNGDNFSPGISDNEYVKYAYAWDYYPQNHKLQGPGASDRAAKYQSHCFAVSWLCKSPWKEEPCRKQVHPLRQPGLS